MPESLKWRSLCRHIRELENGGDNLGPSFLDEVRVRWIRSMAYGMRTTNRNRAAVQEFRGRERKIWGAPDESSSASIFNDHENDEVEEEDADDAERNLAEIAQLNLALLQAEADELNLQESKKEVTDFLARTKASLESFTCPENPSSQQTGLHLLNSNIKL